jgi:hypothetical protein
VGVEKGFVILVLSTNPVRLLLTGKIKIRLSFLLLKYLTTISKPQNVRHIRGNFSGKKKIFLDARDLIRIEAPTKHKVVMMIAVRGRPKNETSKPSCSIQRIWGKMTIRETM